MRTYIAPIKMATSYTARILQDTVCIECLCEDTFSEAKTSSVSLPECVHISFATS